MRIRDFSWPTGRCAELVAQKDWNSLNHELSEFLSLAKNSDDLNRVAESLHFLSEQALTEEHQGQVQRLGQVIFEVHLKNEDWPSALSQWIRWREQERDHSWLQARLRQLARKIAKPVRPPRKHADEGMPLPSGSFDFSAKVSLDESFPLEDFRDQWVEQSHEKTPYLADLNVNEIYRLLPGFEICFLRQGQTLYKGGKESKGLYVLSRGSIELETTQGDRRQINGNEIFGDLAFFGQSPHSANAKATEASEVLFLPKEKLLQILEPLPQLKAQMLMQAQHRLFRHVQANSFVFKTFPMKEVKCLWDFFIPLHTPPGQILIQPQRESDRFFVILSGKVEVIRPGIKGLYLGPGHFVGERGFLLKKPRTARVQAVSDCFVLECDRLSFEELCEAYPHLMGDIKSRWSDLESGQFLSKNPVVD